MHYWSFPNKVKQCSLSATNSFATNFISGSRVRQYWMTYWNFSHQNETSQHRNITLFCPICIYWPIHVWDIPYPYTHMGCPYMYGTTFCPIEVLYFHVLRIFYRSLDITAPINTLYIAALQKNLLSIQQILDIAGYLSIVASSVCR